MKQLRYLSLVILIWQCFIAGQVCAAEEEIGIPLTIEKFLDIAALNDTEFEEILIDELTLKYQKPLRLPAKDIVLSVKQQHEFYFNQDRESPDTTIGLSKLFPFSGTELAVDYQVGASLSSANKSSELSFSFAQPIAENAFGRSTRLLDQIVGLEVEVASHQVVEAYEDYLATILSAYYTWYADYQNLIIARASYAENVKLLDNMNERQKQKIALPIDVNKVKLQVLSRKERLIEFEEQYNNSVNVIQKVIRVSGPMPYIPQDSIPMTKVNGEFAGLFNRFIEESRTFAILQNLEDKSRLQVKRDADDLLPSINIIGGYELSGDDYDINSNDELFYAGISLEWPFTDQVKMAEYEISKILDSKQKLTTGNTYYRLYVQLLNLYLQIQREQKLIEIAEERIELAESVLTDEKDNYSFGKVTLNDYIQAFNALDTNRFNKISHDAQYRKLLVEWLRLNDELVKQSDTLPKLKQIEKNL